MADLVHALLEQALEERVLVGRVAVELRAQAVQRDRRAALRLAGRAEHELVRGLVEIELGDAQDQLVAALVQRAQPAASEPKNSWPRVLLSAVLGTASAARTMHVARKRSSRQSASRASNPESIALIGTMLISRTSNGGSVRARGGPGRGSEARARCER